MDEIDVHLSFDFADSPIGEGIIIVRGIREEKPEHSPEVGQDGPDTRQRRRLASLRAKLHILTDQSDVPRDILTWNRPETATMNKTNVAIPFDSIRLQRFWLQPVW